MRIIHRIYYYSLLHLYCFPLFFFFLMIRRPPRSTLFPSRRSSDLATDKRAAIERYKRVLPIFQAVGDVYKQAIALHMMGLMHLQLGESRLALPYLYEALSLVKTLQEGRLEASIETVIGGAHDVLGNIGQSREHYERAINLARTYKNTQAEASALNNIGKLYNDSGNFQSALDFYLKSLPLFGSPNQRAIHSAILVWLIPVLGSLKKGSITSSKLLRYYVLEVTEMLSPTR